jgi:SAM-dependent methyltransferase/Flp pilus assembly protein TadD
MIAPAPPIGPPIDPDAARRSVAGLATSFGAGDYAGAETHARLLLRLAPTDGTLRRILAAAEVAQTKIEPGIINLRRALLVAPNDVEAHYSLANTLLQAGRPDDAIRHHGHALWLAPDHGEVLINLANAEAARGDPGRARALLRRAIVARPAFSLAIGNLGALAQRDGWSGEAARHFKQVHRIDPTTLVANLNLANAMRDLGRSLESMPYFQRALAIAPADNVVLAGAAGALERIEKIGASENYDALRAVLTACLASACVESNTTILASQALMRRDFSTWPTTGPASLKPDDLAKLNPASGGLLVRHLMDSLITDPDLESFLTKVRARLLTWRAAAGEIGADCADLVRGFAHQGVLNEYLWAVNPQEDRLLDEVRDSLIQSIEAADTVKLMDVYLLAGYRPLAPIEPLRRWAATAASGGNQRGGDLAADLNTLLLDRVREEEIAGEIPDLTPINDVVSTLVRAQYEDNPYPRWNSLARFDPIDSAEQILREIAPNRPALDPLPDEPRVLIAGCGTGRQPIQAAMTYRGASVLAIDLSLPSLAYAKRRASDLGIDTIRFARADILGLTDLPRRFDIIECSGVLHHMAEPEAGLRALLSVLAPGGLMKIALYSAAARSNVTRLRHWITEQGFAPTLEGIRDFRAKLPASGHIDAAATARSVDYNATSAIRDLLFHAQEQQFTVPGLKRLLEDSNLEFLGFLFRDADVKARYLTRFPNDPGCVGLENWADFEANNPLTFVSMYQFWCRRVDYR